MRACACVAVLVALSCHLALVYLASISVRWKHARRIIEEHEDTRSETTNTYTCAYVAHLPPSISVTTHTQGCKRLLFLEEMWRHCADVKLLPSAVQRDFEMEISARRVELGAVERPMMPSPLAGFTMLTVERESHLPTSPLLIQAGANAH